MTSPIIPLPSTAVVGQVAGRQVVLRLADTSTEYAALRSGAMLVDRSHRGRMRVAGARAAELVSGMVTNDVRALTPGQGHYAAALTAKGKIIADLRIFAEEDGLLVDVPPRAFDAWMGMVRKFINPRLAAYSDESASLCALGIFGVASRRIAGEAAGVSPATLGALPPYGHVRVEVDGASVLVARVPDVELEGYELILPGDSFAALWRRAVAAGATPAGLDAWEIARIEAGRPEWGLDIDDSTLPQEANFDELHAISYTKGCYVGQETVARVHFRGHVNRHLRGLLFRASEPPPAGTPLADEGGRVVGDVRSGAVSPRHGPIALGMVRREIAPGGTVTAQWEGGDSQAHVVQLPFPI